MRLNIFFTYKSRGFIGQIPLLISFVLLIATTPVAKSFITKFTAPQATTISHIADENYYVQPIIFFPTNYSVDSAVVNRADSVLAEIAQYYKSKSGRIFHLKPLKVIEGDHPSTWYWCKDGESGCNPGDAEGNLIREINNKGVTVEPSPPNAINTIVFMGGGGWAGTSGELGSERGLRTIIGDVSIYPELDKNCNRVKQYYFKGDPIDSLSRCQKENMASTRQGSGAWAHELGHAFGLPHPNDNGYPVGSPEYQNSIMGNQAIFPKGSFNPKEKAIIANSPFFDEAPPDPCVTLDPSKTTNVTEDITFCEGTVQLNKGATGIITVGAKDITIDGGNVTIDGGNKTGNGIVLNGQSGVTIKNFTIKGFNYAIVASNTSNIQITKNTVSGNGAGAASGDQFRINAEIGSTPGGGILINNISNSHITENTGNGQDVGINLYNSKQNTISQNDFSNNNVWGIRLYASSDNTISGNKAHHVNPCSGHCDSAGMLLVKGSNGNTISSNDLTYSGDGFFIGNESGSPSNNNTISGNDGSYSPHNCFEATFSTGNTFSGNIATHCNWGFWLGFSNATLTGNTIENNEQGGVGWANGKTSVASWAKGYKPGNVTNNIFKDNGGWGITLDPDPPTQVGEFSVANLSTLPQQNSFSGNRAGNCKGVGFTDTDKHAGKCPDGENGQIPVPTATIQPTQAATIPTPTTGSVVKNYHTPTSPGYCAGGNRTNADPKWYIKGGAPTCNFNDATYPLPGTSTIANDDAYCNGEFGGQSHGYFYSCNPSNGSTADIICKDHKGVDASILVNGYVDTICMSNPTNTTYKEGLFKYENAIKVPPNNPYASGKNYDVYQCVDSGIYDFAKGAENVCDKYPWVQNATGTLPTPPSGHTCTDPKPYWDSNLLNPDGTRGNCTFRPDACNNIGPGGNQNTCQTTACDSSHAPDTHATKDEANLACKTYTSDGRNFCCAAGSGGAAPTSSPTSSPTASPTPAVSGGTGTENSHCYNGDADCAPQFKCNRNPGTATSYCIYRNPSDPEGDPYCNSSIYHCEGDASDPAAHTTCDTGNPAPIMGHNYSCRKAGLGGICCTGASGSTASTGKEVRIGGTCTSNTQCVSLKLGNSCVYTNNPTQGVCR